MQRVVLTAAALVTAMAVALSAQRGRTTPPPPPTGATIGDSPATTTLNFPERQAILQLQLAVDRLLQDRWYGSTPRAIKDTPAELDRQALAFALSNRNIPIRRAAIRALGRFLNPYDALPLEILWRNATEAESVRREAEFALIRVLGYTEDAAMVKGARDQLVRMLVGLTNHVDDRLGAKLVQGFSPHVPFLESVPAIYDSLRRLHGLNETQADDLETLLVEAIDKRWPYADGHPGDPWLPVAFVSLAGLERLLDYYPARPIDDRTRLVLLRIGRFGLTTTATGPHPIALHALSNARITDRPLAEYLVNVTCAEPKSCWQFRREGVLLTDVRDPDSARIIDRALEDASPFVRLEMYRRLMAAVKETKTCARAIKAFEDESPVIRMEAIDMLTPDCNERELITRRLRKMATEFGEPPDLPLVPFAARAIVALSKFAPELIPELTNRVTPSDEGWFGIWQYRAAVARVAGLIRDEALALRFVDDPHTNVQYEALTSLALMQSPARWPQALKALESDDYRLVYQGAALLKGAKDREAVMHAVVPALARITKENKDTSRPIRLELLARLKEIAPGDAPGGLILRFYSRDLQVYLTDPDPLVADAAADMYAAMGETRPTPAPRRGVMTTVGDDLLLKLSPNPIVRIDFGLGTIVELGLLSDEAPLTVAQFLRLACGGYYDKQMFYKVAPLNLVQIGSPRPNEYMGFGRFLRDEIGPLRHDYGMVGMWSHGQDTADAQFFVNMSPSPLRNYQYTVFGRIGRGWRNGILVPNGMEILEDLIDGARIVTITHPSSCAPPLR